MQIKTVEGKKLHHQYPGQTSPQPCYVELDCEAENLSADWNGELGNAVPLSVWHGHTRRWAIPALQAQAANSLLDEIAPLAQRVIDGYTSEWDGNNHVAGLRTPTIHSAPQKARWSKDCLRAPCPVCG